KAGRSCPEPACPGPSLGRSSAAGPFPGEDSPSCPHSVVEMGEREDEESECARTTSKAAGMREKRVNLGHTVASGVCEGGLAGILGITLHCCCWLVLSELLCLVVCRE